MIACALCGHPTSADYIATADACPACKLTPFTGEHIPESVTFTLDAQTPDGRYSTDTGLTMQDVLNARANAPRLGVTILAVIREDAPVLTPAQLAAAFGGRLTQEGK